MKIFGTVVDAATKEPLAGASVILYSYNTNLDLGVGTTTGDDGKYSLSSNKLDSSDTRVEFKHLNYEDRSGIWPNSAFGEVELHPTSGADTNNEVTVKAIKEKKSKNNTLLYVGLGIGAFTIVFFVTYRILK